MHDQLARLGNVMQRRHRLDPVEDVRAQELQTREADGGQVALTMAHEFNNILMGFQSLIDLIGRRTDDDEIERHLGSMRRCLSRGKTVTGEVLAVPNGPAPEFVVVDVRRWLEETVTDVKPLLPSTVALELRISGEELFVRADAQRLSQVLVNLALNAREAMPSGGSLVISCEACVSWEKFRFIFPSPDRYLHLKVRDTGIGIPASALHRIFDPLFTTKAYGNGVGLALAKEVVQQHEGSIFVESAVGEGTVFHLFLPLQSGSRNVHEAGADVPTIAPRFGGTAPSAVDSAAGVPESQLVLIIDDDLMLTEGLAAGLEREGRTIITCNDVESAQLIVERCSPSHIVSDVHLSGPFVFEGLELIRHAKRHSPESRLILMTGDAPDALQLEASERGAVAFLQKPFEINELDSILNLVSGSVRSSSAAEGPSLITMPLFDEILRTDALHTFFQPIVALDDHHRYLGYEALARYRSNPLLHNPEVLFDYARRKGRVADLELVCVEHALRDAASFSSGAIFLNVHPDVFTRSRELRELLVRDGSRVGLHRIVLEITEQASLRDDEALFEDIDKLRDLGVRFAFDDVGAAYSHLPFIDRVRPSFLKVSQHFGTAFETDAAKKKIVTNLFTLARDFGCDLILEGIEHASTAAEATELGIRYGQGFLFAHPAEASVFADRVA